MIAEPKKEGYRMSTCTACGQALPPVTGPTRDQLDALAEVAEVAAKERIPIRLADLDVGLNRWAIYCGSGLGEALGATQVPWNIVGPTRFEHRTADSVRIVIIELDLSGGAA